MNNKQFAGWQGELDETVQVLRDGEMEIDSICSRLRSDMARVFQEDLGVFFGRTVSDFTTGGDR